ncbi:hypothetical protein Mpsy_0180 [Methanolobus psychrophilus R15]|nr:hypothetical protein Mpsy_0180 [Methanolobus psychrophilus R15]
MMNDTKKPIGLLNRLANKSEKKSYFAMIFGLIFVRIY